MGSKIMKYYLITYCTDYADEFDVEGMKVFTEDEFKAFIEMQKHFAQMEKDNPPFKDAEWPDGYELYFGTNEFLWYESIEEMIREFKINEITENQYNTLKELNLLRFGESRLFDAFEDEEILGQYWEKEEED